MKASSQPTPVEMALLPVGIVQIALWPTLITLGGDPDPVWSQAMFGAWILGVVLSRISVSEGRELGWRHLIAIAPGLTCVNAMPKTGAIIGLIGLGAMLLERARTGRVLTPLPESQQDL